MKFKRVLSLSAIAAAGVFALAACGNNDKPADTTNTNSGATQVTPTGSTGDTTGTVTQSVDPTEGWSEDQKIYNNYFGTFEDEMIAARSASTVSEKYYHYAKAEASLYENALILPVNTQGGRYAISRIGIGSAPYALWGTDSDKLKYFAIATDFVKASDRATMKTKLVAERKAAAPYAQWSDGSHKTTYDAVKELTALGYTIDKTYKTSITSFPQTYDITNTYRQADSQIICNTTDYLIQYDVAGNIVPALAESWTRSEDGLTYTFKIRQGVKWVDAAGLEHGNVTAQDFVYGMKRTGENGMTSYMLEKIKNYADCASSGDFSTLGVTAVDANTLKIELSEKCDYFLTYLTYNPFTPVNEDFVKEKGESYGTDFQNILYCGPFIVTEASDKSTLKMKKNEKYWDAANVTIDNIIMSYEDGSNEQAMYNKLKDGTYAGLNLSAERKVYAEKDGIFNDYAYVSDTNATSYFGGFNLNRQTYENTYDADSSRSSQTDAQKELAHKALLNTNFRRAILAGLDKVAYNTPSTGADVALFSLRNLYVPYDYVSLSEAAGGYAAGTQYGDIVLAELKKGVMGYVTDLHDGVNAYYNADKAKEFFAKARQELELKDSDVIVLDFPVDATNTVMVAQSQILKANLEQVFENKLVINLVQHKDYYTYLYSNYFVDSASEMNYDFDISSGWGPDHGDPSTYLNTFLPYGDMIRLCGIQDDSTKEE